MSLNIKIKDNLEITLGEIKEELIYALEEKGIKYFIPFDKINLNNVKETIIQIPDLKIEISVENDIVTYIKSGCTDYTIVGKTEFEKNSNLSLIKDIKDKILKMYDINEKNLFIEKINIKAMEMIIVVKDENNDSCRIHIMSNNQGNVFIYNLRYSK